MCLPVVLSDNDAVEFVVLSTKEIKEVPFQVNKFRFNMKRIFKKNIDYLLCFSNYYTHSDKLPYENQETLSLRKAQRHELSTTHCRCT